MRWGGGTEPLMGADRFGPRRKKKKNRSLEDDTRKEHVRQVSLLSPASGEHQLSTRTSWLTEE